MPDDRVVLVLGDIEGHTLESASVMGRLRTAVVAYATEGRRPAALLERVDRLLARLGTELLDTCCVVALDTGTGTGTAEVALAGHPEPFARLPDGAVPGRFEVGDSDTDPPVPCAYSLAERPGHDRLVGAGHSRPGRVRTPYDLTHALPVTVRVSGVPTVK
ncbi:PP2C family protein-serine/threonine phosphatase [Streptomyces sp. NPDC096057]|uniref:PP2C family protein-serine/threonine phosphatase n=1 Tax=Streptomyces sp. NPDC096057 TaxID=3155543 RepID=UPI00332A9CAA